MKTDFIPHLLSVLHRRQTLIPRVNVLSLSSDTTPSLCSLWCSTLLFNGRVDHTKVVNLWVVNKIYRMLQKQHQHIRWMQDCRMLAGVGEGGGDKHHSLFSELPDPQMHTQGQISISPTRPPPTVTHTRQKPPKLPLIPSAKRHQCVY